MDNAELKSLNEKFEKGISEIRQAQESNNTAAVKQIADGLADINKKQDAAIAELKIKADKVDAAEKKIAELEADLKRGNFAGNGDVAKKEAEEAAKAEVKAFETFLKVGQKAMPSNAEAKYLRTDLAVDGGYLCPKQYATDIIKAITEFSDVRSMASVMTISSKSIEMPKRTSRLSAYWVGEGQTLTEGQSKYGVETLSADKMAAYCDVTFEMLSDAAVDVRGLITSDVGEAFAELEGAGFNSGNGKHKPEGFMFNSSVGYYASGDASGIEPDALWGIQGEIKKGYNLAWLFNRKTLFQHLATMKDGDGRYLFRIGEGSLPNTFAGLPYGIDPNMPDVAAGNYPIIVADWKRFYQIVDNDIIEVIEDNLTQATSGKKRYLFFRRTGGQVIQAEAGKKLKIATS